MTPAPSSRDVAVVTGAARGIGRAIVLEFARRGVDVAALCRPRPGVVGSSVAPPPFDESASRDVRILTISCDVANARSVDKAAARVFAEFGTPRFVINNAGVVVRAPLEQTSEVQWDEVIDINLKGPYLVTRAFLAAMKKAGRGRVIQIGSISSTLGTAHHVAYCASKWGVVGFTKALAEELRHTGLQTMAILPGSVDTDMLKGSGFDPDLTAADVARATVHAALDAVDAMHGASIDLFGP